MDAKQKAKDLLDRLSPFEGTAFGVEGKLRERSKLLVLGMAICDIVLDEYAREHQADEIFWRQVKEEIRKDPESKPINE